MKKFPTKVATSGRVRVCLELVKEQQVAGKVVLDIGSSFGWLEKELLHEGAARLIGIEPNEDAVKFAARSLGGRARFLVGSALDIPLQDDIVDAAIFFDVVEHLPGHAEAQALGEIHRVLKEDGLLFLSTPNAHIGANLFDPAWYLGHRHYSKEKIENLLKKTGFRIFSHTIQGGWPAVLYMLWFYFTKWILRQNSPESKILAAWDDQSYSRKGFVTHFVVARKI